MCARPAERTSDAGDEATGNQERPAFDVDGATARSERPPSTNQPAESPSADRVTPAMKNAATPSCAIARAAALPTEMNGSSAAEDSTTRMRDAVD